MLWVLIEIAQEIDYWICMVFSMGFYAIPTNKPQSFTKYDRRILVFMWNSALREKFDFCFLRYFF